METRLVRLEEIVRELTTEVKLTTQALSSIDATLIELKAVTMKLSDIQVSTSSHQLMLESANARLKNVETRLSSMETLVSGLDKREAVQGMKIGSAEKFVWALVSAGFGLAVAMYGNGGAG